MHKDILAAIIGDNETISFCGVEPLYFSCCHDGLLIGCALAICTIQIVRTSSTEAVTGFAAGLAEDLEKQTGRIRDTPRRMAERLGQVRISRVWL